MQTPDRPRVVLRGMNDQLRAARALRTTIRATRQETEEARCLAPKVVEGLIAGGLCRLAVPASLGGHDTEPATTLQILEELAWADASVAWIVWNNQFVGLASRYSPEEVRRELFGDVRRLFANSTRPSGKAIALEAGFNVSGRWSLVSGCELADWIPVMCVVLEGNEPRMLAEGVPETRMIYLPKGTYNILDTWHVGGLRGTGSHDIVVDDVYVPAERTFSFTDPAQDDRPLSRMPFFATVCACCAALSLGIAQSAVDTFLELATSKVQVDPCSRDAGSARGPSVGGVVRRKVDCGPTPALFRASRGVGGCLHPRPDGDNGATRASVGERAPRRARFHGRSQVHVRSGRGVRPLRRLSSRAGAQRYSRGYAARRLRAILAGGGRAGATWPHTADPHFLAPAII